MIKKAESSDLFKTFTAKNRLYVGLLILIINSQLCAQENRYSIKHFSEQQGLSDHRIRDLIEHDNGFVYVATMNGLNRFDGYEFVPVALTEREYNVLNQSGVYITLLYYLNDGRILVAFYPLTRTPTFADIYDPRSGIVEEVWVQDIDEVAREIKLDSATLNYRVRNNNTFTNGIAFEDQVENHINVYQDKDNTEAELILSNGDTVNFSAFWQTLPFGNFRVFGKDFSRNFYIGSANGLLKADSRQQPLDTYLAVPVKEWEYRVSGRAIAILEDGRVMMSSVRDPIAILDPKTDILTIPVIRDEVSGESVELINVRHIHSQNDSIVWLVHNTGILSRVNLNTNTSRYYLKQPNVRFLAALTGRDGKIYIGTNTYFGETRILVFDPVSGNTNLLDFASEFLSSREYRITSMMEAKDGTFWFGTNNGLFHMDIDKKKVLAGYYHQDWPSNNNYPFPGYSVMNSKTTYALLESNDNELFVGTEYGGMNVIDLKTNLCRVFNNSNGLAGNTVCSIVAGDNGYWIGTYSGLSYYNPSTGNFRNFYSQNGLPHNEMNRFSSTKKSHLGIFFGGMNGFFRLQEKDMLIERDSVPILFSEANILGADGTKKIIHTVAEGQPPFFSIPANNRSCSFKFSLASYLNTINHTYYYRLLSRRTGPVNEETPWISLGNNREIKFEYLPAGKYNLQVRGTTSEGNPTKVYNIQLEVNEFFYKTGWFFLICILIIAGIFYIIYHYRLKQALKLEQMRNQLSSDLHDDVGSVLSGVAYQMELLAFSVGEEHKTLVQQVAASSRTAMMRLRDVVWVVNSRNGKFSNLLDRMQEFCRELLEPLNIECNFNFHKVNINTIIQSEVRHSLLLIFKEFLSNTIKHSGATKVIVEFDQKGQLLLMRIKDNGKGLDKEALNGTGQGLKNIKMRAGKINAKLMFLTEDGFGLELLFSPE